MGYGSTRSSHEITVLTIPYHSSNPPSASPWLRRQCDLCSKLGGSWEAGMRREVPSKSHSCSEMVEGHRKLISAKMERDSPSTMERKIQEISLWISVVLESATAIVIRQMQWWHAIPNLGLLLGIPFLEWLWNKFSWLVTPVVWHLVCHGFHLWVFDRFRIGLLYLGYVWYLNTTPGVWSWIGTLDEFSKSRSYLAVCLQCFNSVWCNSSIDMWIIPPNHKYMWGQWWLRRTPN